MVNNKELNKNNNIKDAFKVLWISFLVGAQMFGSGMAVMPILKKEFVERNKWITDEELLDIISICRFLPGANTVNIISFIGNKKCGIWGGIAAAFGIAIVPIITIIGFTYFYETISKLEVLKNALAGITVCVCALIFNFLIDLWKKAIIGPFSLIVCLISFALYMFTDISILAIVLVMGLVSFIFEKYFYNK